MQGNAGSLGNAGNAGSASSDHNVDLRYFTSHTLVVGVRFWPYAQRYVSDVGYGLV